MDRAIPKSAIFPAAPLERAGRMTALPSTTSLPLWAWGGFLLFIAAMLALDLGVFRKNSKAVEMKEALGWCAVWLSLALAFNGLIWWWQGSQSASEWFTAYLVELCLSVDNVFVFDILIFIGAKMLLTGIDVHILTGFSLGIIASVLALSIIASLVTKTSASSTEKTSGADDVVEGAALTREGQV